MTDKRKKAREREILRAVYDESAFDEVIEQERPDFVLRREGLADFGIEITELFDSESDARVRNRPSYVSDLLAGKPPIHKDDIDVLKISEVTISDADGKIKATGVPSIIRPTPTVDERARTLSTAIEKKEPKALLYTASLDHVNLIVMDSAPTWAPESLNVGELLIEDLRRPLLNSQFREIYLVTGTRGKGSFFVPMRMALLLAELYLFGESISSFEGADVSRQDLIPLFVEFAATQLMPLSLVKARNGMGAALGNAVVEVTPDGAVSVLDQADFELPGPLPVPNTPGGVIHRASFVEHYEKVRRDSVFVTEIAMPVVVEPSFSISRGTGWNKRAGS